MLVTCISIFVGYNQERAYCVVYGRRVNTLKF
jgi:hypothetical protein